MHINAALTPAHLKPRLDDLFTLSGQKVRKLHRSWQPSQGTPVVTTQGRYTSRAWTEWTQGFQYGWAILQFDATDDEEFLRIGHDQTLARMAGHVSHTGVHDHGFNNLSTYGNLRRLILEGRVPHLASELDLHELALKLSGAVQASRWSTIHDGSGYIYSFNGPHSLFVDTIRSLRVLALAHQLGHMLRGENDRRISLLERLVQHAVNTNRYNVFYGEGRDVYDISGRVAHEAIFNMNDGRYRCANSQQGYSPFTTWTRGLAWVLAGNAELLEWSEVLPDPAWEPFGGKAKIVGNLERAARATAEYYIGLTAADGIPYWDTGAPGLAQLGDYQNRPADPYNGFEPVDSSAAAISAQGLIRLGRYLTARGDQGGARFVQAGLTVADALFAQPYLSEDPNHEGLILHSIYHRPNGWDYTPAGRTVPCGESSMWGDYHAVELALLIKRLADQAPYLTFFGPVAGAEGRGDISGN